jgi:hypothetical protein
MTFRHGLHLVWMARPSVDGLLPGDRGACVCRATTADAHHLFVTVIFLG